jgi:hypothetical protein
VTKTPPVSRERFRGSTVDSKLCHGSTLSPELWPWRFKAGAQWTVASRRTESAYKKDWNRARCSSQAKGSGSAARAVSVMVRG